jgi:hypothetical protein
MSIELRVFPLFFSLPSLVQTPSSCQVIKQHGNPINAVNETKQVSPVEF